MPAGGFKTFTAGQILTAADVNAYLMQGVLVFTNESARDTAITSPVEGMVAYLTAPTVPAATGGTTNVPSGVQTVYNGSVWVCATPVASQTTNAGSTTSTSYTATLSGSPGTNPSVTLVTGARALVTIGSLMYSSSSGNSWLSFKVSGATTVASSDSYGAVTATTPGITATRSFVLGGLTAGTNTFTLEYKGGAFTANFENRTIWVQGVP